MSLMKQLLESLQRIEEADPATGSAALDPNAQGASPNTTIPTGGLENSANQAQPSSAPAQAAPPQADVQYLQQLIKTPINNLQARQDAINPTTGVFYYGAVRQRGGVVDPSPLPLDLFQQNKKLVAAIKSTGLNVVTSQAKIPSSFTAGDGTPAGMAQLDSGSLAKLKDPNFGKAPIQASGSVAPAASAPAASAPAASAAPAAVGDASAVASNQNGQLKGLDRFRELINKARGIKAEGIYFKSSIAKALLAEADVVALTPAETAEADKLAQQWGDSQDPEVMNLLAQWSEIKNGLSKSAGVASSPASAEKVSASAPKSNAEIAQSVTSIAKDSGIPDPNSLKIGQKIKLPDGTEYTVAQGDTLWGISQGKFKGNKPATKDNAPGEVAQSQSGTASQRQQAEKQPLGNRGDKALDGTQKGANPKTTIPGGLDSQPSTAAPKVDTSQFKVDSPEVFKYLRSTVPNAKSGDYYWVNGQRYSLSQGRGGKTWKSDTPYFGSNRETMRKQGQKYTGPDKNVSTTQESVGYSEDQALARIIELSRH